NFPAAMAASRTSPLDQVNLNRSFPGDPTRGPAAQIAYYIEHELLPRCDFVLDIHSGGSSLTYLPSTLGRRPDTPEGVERAIELMRVFGAPIGYFVDGGGWGDMTLTAAAARAGGRALCAHRHRYLQARPRPGRTRRLRLSSRHRAGALNATATPDAAPAVRTNFRAWITPRLG